jgi:hypothetical protein
MVLGLQTSVGNAAVQRLIAGHQQAGMPTAQRCGHEVHDGCPCAEPTAEPVTVARQGDGGAPACSPGTMRVAGSVADSVAASLAAGCIDEAFWILNGRAMFDLLPLLASLRGRPGYGDVRTNAAAKGGDRMATAVFVVDLQAGGSPITGADIRDLIDRLGTLPPGQRADIFRFIGKLAVITVRGFDIDFSYCRSAAGPGCAPALRDAIAWAGKMQQEYQACRGKPGMTDGQAVERCVHASLTAQGIATQVGGLTSPSGAVTITAAPVSQCQPLLDKGTEIHEGVHQTTQARLQRRFGAGTPAFDTAWNDPNSWIDDEVAAYGAEIPFYREVLAAIAKLEGKI